MKQIVPCTRGLECFKKGCPQASYEDNPKYGCPLWLELVIPDPDNPTKKIVRKKCVDLWYFTLLYNMLPLLEGNQQATESFRNGMLEVNPDNPKQTRPKSMNVVMQVLQQADKLKELPLKRKEK